MGGPYARAGHLCVPTSADETLSHPSSPSKIEMKALYGSREALVWTECDGVGVRVNSILLDVTTEGHA